MSGLLEVLDACRQISDLVAGINTTFLNVPETEPTSAMLPMTITRYDTEQRGTLTMFGLEEWHHPVEQVLLVRRLGNRAGEDAEVMPYLLSLIAQYRSHVNLLGSNRAIVNNVEYQIGPFSFFNVDYWGASLHFQVYEAIEVQAQISA